jgi:hypothetical protein
MVPLIALTVTAMVPMIDPYSCATNPAIARQAAVGPISTLFYWCLEPCSTYACKTSRVSFYYLTYIGCGMGAPARRDLHTPGGKVPGGGSVLESA